jgi:4a-hydroxytetrahydrobiopterin dehydratase
MTDVLNPDALQTTLHDLGGWDGTVDDGIRKTYTFDDFAQAMAFVNRVADIAEDMNHHPDIGISWNRVELRIISHSAGGVTQDCLDLASRIEAEATG